MRRIISREDAKAIVNLLREKQPRTFEDFSKALGMRPFEIKKLLRALEDEKVLIRESLSGEEKFWLNEEIAVEFFERNPLQITMLKHPKGKKRKGKREPDSPMYG